MASSRANGIAALALAVAWLGLTLLTFWFIADNRRALDEFTSNPRSRGQPFVYEPPIPVILLRIALTTTWLVALAWLVGALRFPRDRPRILAAAVTGAGILAIVIATYVFLAGGGVIPVDRLVPFSARTMGQWLNICLATWLILANTDLPKEVGGGFWTQGFGRLAGSAFLGSALIAAAAQLSAAQSAGLAFSISLLLEYAGGLLGTVWAAALGAPSLLPRSARTRRPV